MYLSYREPALTGTWNSPFTDRLLICLRSRKKLRRPSADGNSSPFRTPSQHLSIHPSFPSNPQNDLASTKLSSLPAPTQVQIYLENEKAKEKIIIKKNLEASSQRPHCPGGLIVSSSPAWDETDGSPACSFHSSCFLGSSLVDRILSCPAGRREWKRENVGGLHRLFTKVFQTDSRFIEKASVFFSV